MPDVLAFCALPWDDGATIIGGFSAIPWDDGDTIIGIGAGAYVPHDPPAGSVPIEPAPAAPGARIVAAPSYRTAHTVQVIDERTEQPLPVISAQFGHDSDSMFWSATFDGGEALRAALLEGEQPAVVRLELDGHPWRFVVDTISRNRTFEATGVSVRGLSQTVAATAPYQGESNWTNDGDTTAAQLMAIANLYTGVGLSAEFDDWVIPDRVFSFTGTPLAVVRRIADAIGAMVLSDPALPVLRIVPRYRVLPNEWAVIPPDVELPIGCAITDTFERADQPAYNAIALSGQQQGAAAIVRLEGTDGGFVAPLETDQLLTQDNALRQRGMSKLGAGGERADVTVRLPVRYGEDEPGVLTCGQVVRVLDTDGTWHGMVRGVNVTVPTMGDGGDVSVYQSCRLERHLSPILGTVVVPVDLDPLVFAGPLGDRSWTVGIPVALDLAPFWSGGTEPYRWSMRAGVLPPGLTLDPDDGTVTGSPTEDGTFSGIRFRAVDAVDNMADSDAFEAVVADAVQFSGTVAGQSGTLGSAFSVNLSSHWSGGTPPYAYTVQAGTLPAGLALGSSTGIISGTPSALGTSSGLKVRATDAATTHADSNTFAFVVSPPALVYSGTIANQTPTVGAAFSLNVSSHWSGGVTPYAYTVNAGTLPAGLSLNSSTGVISGTPTTAGTSSGVVIRATDAAAQTANSNSFSLTVAAAGATVGDPLWSNAWLRLLLDSGVADAGPNALPTARVACGSGGLNSTSDVQTAAAKYGAKGWLCWRDDTAVTASAIVANISALSSGVRTWGTQNWWVGGWCRVGDNSTPTGTRQRRFSLGYQSTNGLWFSTLAGVVNVQLRATGYTTPFSAATIGTVTGGTGSTLSTPAGTIADNNHHHIACGRNGSTFRIWVDGVVRAECTVAIDMPPIDEVSVGGVPSLGLLTTCSGDPTVTADYLDDWVVYLGTAAVTTQFYSPPAEAIPTGAGVMRQVYTGATLGSSSPVRTTTGNPKAARDAWAAACSNVGVMDFESNCSVGDPLPTALSFAGSSPARTGTIAGGAFDQMLDNFSFGFLGSFNTTGAHPAELDGIFVYFEPPATLTVTFSAAIAAFGCYITDSGDSNEKITARLTKSGGGTLDYIVPRAPSSSDAQCLWWGFVDPTGTTYTKVEFVVTSSGGSLGFDDFSVGVPV